MQQIVVENYNPAWKETFEALKAVYTQHLGGIISSIEHVGSTSVPGLAAKPILDIDLVIADEEKLPQVSEILATLGYIFRGDLGIPQRYAYGRSSDHVPFTPGNSVWMTHHLYCCIEGSVSLRNHRLLRDALLADDRLREEYAALKLGLADTVQDDIDAYIEGKSEFIGRVLLQQGILPDEVSNIADQNKNPNR